MLIRGIVLFVLLMVVIFTGLNVAVYTAQLCQPSSMSEAADTAKAIGASKVKPPIREFQITPAADESSRGKADNGTISTSKISSKLRTEGFGLIKPGVMNVLVFVAAGLLLFIVGLLRWEIQLPSWFNKEDESTPV